MNRRLHSPGHVAVIVTLVIATLVGGMSLGVDVGLLYLNQVRLQKATDAAVLGASASALGSPNPLPVGIQCSTQNRVPGQSYQFAPPLVAPLLGVGSWNHSRSPTP